MGLSDCEITIIYAWKKYREIIVQCCVRPRQCLKCKFNCYFGREWFAIKIIIKSLWMYKYRLFAAEYANWNNGIFLCFYCWLASLTDLAQICRWLHAPCFYILPLSEWRIVSIATESQCMPTICCSQPHSNHHCKWLRSN